MKTTTSTEYQVGTKIDLNAVEAISAPQMVYNGITRARLLVKLEARMLAYDTLHGTHYRRIRHAAMRAERDKAFEDSIGLVRSK